MTDITNKELRYEMKVLCDELRRDAAETYATKAEVATKFVSYKMFFWVFGIGLLIVSSMFSAIWTQLQTVQSVQSDTREEVAVNQTKIDTIIDLAE